MDGTAIKSISSETAPRLFVIRRHRWNKAAEKMAGVGFFIFFPGFLIYHFLVAATPLPPILGGLFGISAAFFALLLPLISWPVFKRYLSASPLYVGLFFIFMVYVSLWTGIHWALAGSEEMKAAGIQALETLVFWIAMFFVGMFFPRISGFFKITYAALFFLLFGALVFYVAATGDAMFRPRKFFNAEQIASYQLFARSALGIIIAAIVAQRAPAARFIVIIGGFVTLFILGARSELVAFVFLSIVLLGLFSWKGPRYFLYCTLFALAFFLVFIFLEIEIQSRQAELMHLASSSSWQARMQLQDIALNQIAKSPIIGVFGGHVIEGVRTSGYSHNVLSAWVNFGIMGFFLYIVLTITATVASVYHLVNRSYDKDWLFSFCFNFVSLVLMIGAKAVFWPLPALGWGLYVRARTRCRADPSHRVAARKGLASLLNEPGIEGRG